MARGQQELAISQKQNPAIISKKEADREIAQQWLPCNLICYIIYTLRHKPALITIND